VSRCSVINFFRTQLIAILFGYIGAVILGEIDYHFLSKYWQITSIICIVLLLTTLLFGISIEGAAGVNAKAWLRVFNMTFQPSELAKIGFIITFATHLDRLKKKELLKSFFHILLLVAHLLVPVGICHLQGDDGASIIFVCIFLVMCFMAGVEIRYFLILFGCVIALFPFAWKFIFSEYQKKRIIALFDLEKYALDIGFQQIQGKVSIGSGKIFGHGLFNGPRVNYSIVPVQESDFILSVAGEELGFLGCILVILPLLILILRSFKIATKSYDDFGSYLVFGFFGLILFQSVFNIGMCLSILPVMGVTLPFFSSGGSSAACLYFGLGIVQSVFSRRKDGDLIPIIDEIEEL
jgi:rod shape determining protein RodA